MKLFYFLRWAISLIILLTLLIRTHEQGEHPLEAQSLVLGQEIVSDTSHSPMIHNTINQSFESHRGAHIAFLQETGGVTETTETDEPEPIVPLEPPQDIPQPSTVITSTSEHNTVLPLTPPPDSPLEETYLSTDPISSTGVVLPSPEEAEPFAGSHLDATDDTSLAGTAQMMLNGAFDWGLWKWQLYYNYGHPGPQADYRTGGLKTPSIFMGYYHNANDQMWQTAYVPPDATNLTIDFRFSVSTEETYQNADTNCYGLWTSNGSGYYIVRCLDAAKVGNTPWTRETYSLTSGELAKVLGKTVRMVFITRTNSSLRTITWIDDASLRVTSPSLGAPSAPSNLTATASSNTKIVLRWKDTSTNESGFQVDLLSNNEWKELGRASANTNAGTITFSAPVCGVQYTYRIRAFNAYGLSSPSNSATVTMAACAPTTGSVSGRVIDSAGKGIGSIRISSTTGSYQATTQSDGTYVLNDLKKGTYRIIPTTTRSCTFSPSSLIVTVPPDSKNRDFVATCTTATGEPIISVSPTSLTFDTSATMLASSSSESGHPGVELPQVLWSDHDSLLLDFQIPLADEQIIEENGQSYQYITLPNEGMFGEIGKPELPLITRMIAIPPGKRATVQVLNTQVRTHEGYLVYPSQPIPYDSGETPPFEIDEDFYTQDVFYPSQPVVLEPPVSLRGTNVATLRLMPFLYNPGTGQLQVYTHIQVKISFVADVHLSDSVQPKRSPYVDDVYSQFIVNYDTAGEPLPERDENAELAANGADFLIVTAPEFATAANTLANWRNQHGLVTKVVTTQETGRTATAITTYIQNAYNTWNPSPSFVLLLGDAEFIPPHYRTKHKSYEELYIGTDLYYSTLDGKDYFPDISIGRIPVDTSTQATQAINAIIDYEKNPPTDANFYKRMAAAAYFEDKDKPSGEADRRFLQTAEEVRSFLETQGYQGQRIYTTGTSVNPLRFSKKFGNGESVPNDLRRPQFAWDGDSADITRAVNDGIFLLLHRDHGYFSGWGHPAYSVSDVSNLKNGAKRPLVLSINCETGWFDDETDNYGKSKGLNFAESWLRNPNGGAIGVIAASRMSYSGHNDDFTRGVIDALWPKFFTTGVTGKFATPQRRLGAVMNYGKMHYHQYGKLQKPGLDTFELFHYFGDPTTQLWLSQPDLVQKSFTISNKGTADLKVTGLVAKNTSCWMDMAMNTALPLTIAPGKSEQVLVTVDDRCAKAGTHTEQIMIISNDSDKSPYPNGVNVSLNVGSTSDVRVDYSESDKDDEDTLIKTVIPGEHVDTTIRLRNLGNDEAEDINITLTTAYTSYISIVDSDGFYKGVGGNGSTGYTDDQFVFDVAADTPIGTIIPFTLKMSSPTAAKTWADTFAVEVVPDTTPPNTPSSPSPQEGKTSDTSDSITLTWQGGDPDGDTVTYDVYMYTENPLSDMGTPASTVGLVCDDVSRPVCRVSNLSGDTQYYWHVIATDVHGAYTSGPYWTFQTKAIAAEAGVRLIPRQTILSGLPRETLNYSIDIKNTSSVTDTFDLTTSGLWPATVSPTSVGPLVAGATDMFTVTVDIPSTVEHGASNETTITATSHHAITMTHTVIVQSNVPARDGSSLYLPFVMR